MTVRVIACSFKYALLLASTILAKSACLQAESDNWSAQQVPVPARGTPEQPSAATLDLVTVNALVTDDDGRVLSDLRPGNFRIRDNGTPQRVIGCEQASAPITVVMLLEYSSASYNYFANKAAEWSDQFLGHLEARDWVALSTFNLKPTVRVDFTHNKMEIRNSLATLGFPGFSDSNLFDALIDTLDKLDRVKGRKSILLLATGANSFSSSTLDDVFKRLRRSDATIFVVGLAEEEFVRYEGSSISYAQAKSWLSAFADKTGGLALFPRFQSELPEIFRSVTGFLRSEYALTYRPPLLARDGAFHKIDVEIVGPDGKPLKVTDEKGKRHGIRVVAREGYFAQSKPMR